MSNVSESKKSMNPVQAIKGLYHETVQALKKCTWPTRDELKGETFASISFLVIMAAFLFIVDRVFMLAIEKICM